MKIKLFLTIFLSIICLAMNAESYTVSTNVQKKAVLLETFVGTKCKWSSEAPDFVKKIEGGLGADKVNPVNIHCGNRSIPSYGDPDYRTSEGDHIASMLGGINGRFPNGAVNRNNWNFDNQYIFGRYDWATRARQVVAEDAPVNLWAKAVYNGATHQMTVRVEGYFTGADIAAQQRLNVLLTENNFVGLQVTHFGYEYDFVHQHMLRATVSYVEGDMLENCQPHTYFVKEYIYDVPTAINNLPVNPAELELVIFVAGSDNKHVMNSITVKPTYENMNMPLNASILKDKIGVTDGYRFNFLPLVLSNRCDSELTSATFDVTFNNVTVERKWEGVLTAFGEQEISLPVDWSNANAGRNEYSVTLKTLNGQNVTARPVKGYFDCPIFEVPADLTLKLYTSADKPSDFAYSLYGMDGSVIKSFGPYEADKAVEEHLHLIPGKTYCFEIFAKWGNGFTPYGSALQLCDQSGNQLHMVDRVEGYGSRLFFTVKSESLNVNTTYGQNMNRALATFSAAYPTTPSDQTVEAYYAEQKDASTIALRQIVPNGDVLVIPANVGVVLTTPNATAFQMTSTDLPAAYVETANLLQPTGADGVNVSTTENAYILGKKSNDILFHVLSTSDRHIPANRAYLRLPSSMQATAIKMVFGDETTGIEHVTINDNNTAIYDLSGRKVSSVVKGGIYIKNGKKYIVK